MPNDPESRCRRASDALHGLSVGDAFGERMFNEPAGTRLLPQGPWRYTDDTLMAMSVFWCLKRHGCINQRSLVSSFVHHYDPSRGYGSSMYGVFSRIRQGEEWEAVSKSLFQGLGSFGNGAAMRVCPLGAYFADDPELCANEARLSAEVTHAHPEGIAGAIAVALAAAYACKVESGRRGYGLTLIEFVLPYVPGGEERQKLERAAQIPANEDARTVAALLGNGSQVSAQDTVPFCIWCAGTYLNDFEEALWSAVTVLGDMDTNCAIVGGIVASHVGISGVPVGWAMNREVLPGWYSA